MLCIPNSASKTADNWEKRDYERNSLLFLNRWRYFDILGLLLLNFTRETLRLPHPASKPNRNREKRNFVRNLRLFLNRWRYFDVEGLLCSTLREKRCVYRIQRQNPTRSEKKAVLNEIRCYSSTVGDIWTF
jgi:hypothetical protein